jgi:hypothetical protein
VFIDSLLCFGEVGRGHSELPFDLSLLPGLPIVTTDVTTANVRVSLVCVVIDYDRTGATYCTYLRVKSVRTYSM